MRTLILLLATLLPIGCADDMVGSGGIEESGVVIYFTNMSEGEVTLVEVDLGAGVDSGDEYIVESGEYSTFFLDSEEYCLGVSYVLGDGKTVKRIYPVINKGEYLLIDYVLYME